MLLRRNMFLLGTNKRLLFHCQSKVRLLFRVMQTSKFCLEEILKENLRKVHSNSCCLIHKGEMLLALAQHARGCSWPVIPEKREVLLVGKKASGLHAWLPVSPRHRLLENWTSTKQDPKSTMKLVGYISATVIFTIDFVFQLQLQIRILSCIW